MIANFNHGHNFSSLFDRNHEWIAYNSRDCRKGGLIMQYNIHHTHLDRHDLPASRCYCIDEGKEWEVLVMQHRTSFEMPPDPSMRDRDFCRYQAMMLAYNPWPRIIFYRQAAEFAFLQTADNDFIRRKREERFASFDRSEGWYSPYSSGEEPMYTSRGGKSYDEYAVRLH